MELLVLSILADLSCKLSEESFSSRCDIEVFRHLELCRKHARFVCLFKGKFFVFAKTLQYMSLYLGRIVEKYDV